jgi:hypothetical protein
MDIGNYEITIICYRTNNLSSTLLHTISDNQLIFFKKIKKFSYAFQ